MSYDAKVIANYFLTLGTRDNTDIFPMQIQKLLYLGHGWSLALRGKPLILNSIEAWKYGPVVPPIYQEFKEFRADAITRPARVSSDAPIDPESKSFIESVWERYKPFNGLQLSAMTHEPGSAWYIVAQTEGLNSVIPDQLILDEFTRRKNLKN
jgi:uncharacterized phage-associated protein